MMQLFNQRAVQKRHQPGERNGPITLLTPPLRLTLGVGMMIAIGGALWATLARIPLSVQGTGVLLPVSSINASLSPSSGTAIWMFQQPVQPWHAQAQRFVNEPDQFSDQDVARLAQLIVGSAEAVRMVGTGERNASRSKEFASNLEKTYAGQWLDPNRLILWVQSSSQQAKLSSALDQLRRTLRDSQEKQSNIRQKQVILGQELLTRRSYLANMRGLEQRGFVSKASVLQEQAQVDNISSQILSNKNELIAIANDEARAYQELRNELATMIGQELIFSPPRGAYLSQIVPNDGESVSQGDVLLELSHDALDEPEMVSLFLSSREMAQVFPGQRLLATPVGYQRSEVGGIQGKVVSMAKLPSGLEDVKARVGIQSLAEVIMQSEPAPTLAVIALERAGKEATLNSGGYRWSSRGSLPFPPTPGDRLDVEITTRMVAPIELAIPILRRFFGLTPPSKPGDAAEQHQNR